MPGFPIVVGHAAHVPVAHLKDSHSGSDRADSERLGLGLRTDRAACNFQCKLELEAFCQFCRIGACYALRLAVRKY